LEPTSFLASPSSSPIFSGNPPSRNPFSPLFFCADSPPLSRPLLFRGAFSLPFRHPFAFLLSFRTSFSNCSAHAIARSSRAFFFPSITRGNNGTFFPSFFLSCTGCFSPLLSGWLSPFFLGSEMSANGFFPSYQSRRFFFPPPFLPRIASSDLFQSPTPPPPCRRTSAGPGLIEPPLTGEQCRPPLFFCTSQRVHATFSMPTFFLPRWRRRHQIFFSFLSFSSLISCVFVSFPSSIPFVRQTPTEAGRIPVLSPSRVQTFLPPTLGRTFTVSFSFVLPEGAAAGSGG